MWKHVLKIGHELRVKTFFSTSIFRIKLVLIERS